MQVHEAFAVGEDLVVVLHDRVGREPAVLLRQAHRPSRRMEPHAELLRGPDLGTDQVAAAARVHVEVIGARRAATERELGQPDPRRHVRRFLVEQRPARVQRGEPLEQRAVDRRPVTSREVLVDVVVRVDEARRDKATVGIDHGAGVGLGITRRSDTRHQAVSDGNPSAGKFATIVVDRRNEQRVAHQQIRHCGRLLTMSDVRATLPVHPLDLEPFRLGGPADRAAVAARLDEACRDSGFLLVTGHGVPVEVCDAVLDAFGAFFARPLDEKLRYVVTDDEANRGYSALGKEGLAYSRGDLTPPDLFEAFNVGAEDTTSAYYEEWRSFFARNLWPDTPPDLRDVWMTYEQCVRDVADALLRAMAMALDLDEQWFVERCRHAIITTRAINYQRAPGASDPEPDQMRMGAHTDYGVLTVLLADDQPGLQVFRDERWHDVAIPHGTFVCNIGDMLERW